MKGFVGTVAVASGVPATFNAASELGRGAMAKAFKQAEIDTLALRLVRG